VAKTQTGEPESAPVQSTEVLSTLDPSKLAPMTDEPSRRLVLAPAGPWGEQMARRVGAALAQLGPLQLGPRVHREAGAAVLAWDGEAVAQARGDLLLAAEPSLLDPDGALAVIRPGSTALVVSDADTPERLARALSPESRTAILERELALHWVAPPEAVETEDLRGEADGGAASLFLTGASLAAMLGPGKEDSIEATGAGAEARWLRAGAEAVRSLDAESLDPARHVQELDFRPRRSVPRMPAPEDDADRRAGWAKRIRRFHVSGSAPGAIPRLPSRTAVLGSLVQELREQSPHPFVVVHTEEAERPIAARRLRDLLSEATEEIQNADRAARALEDNLDRLVTLAARTLAQGEAEVDLQYLLSGAGERLLAELSLSEEAERTLADDLGELRRVLPADATLLDLRAGAGTPLRLYLKVLEAVCEPRQQRFVEELKWLCERLRDLLQLDRMATGEGRKPEALAAALGGAASQYLDTAALSQTLPEGTRAAVLGEERRRRIERALTTLESQLERQEELSRVIVLQLPGADLALAGTEQHENPDPLAAAAGLFDGVSQSMAELFRAARTARLEAEARYRPELHDKALADLDWEAFTGEELDLVPRVIAVTSGERLRKRDQTSLSELVGSSRPVQVLVEDQLGAADETENLSRFHVDLGYLVMAHREAFAVGATPTRPERLIEGLARMARARRPALALLQLPPAEPALLRPLLAEAALRGRACRDFRYDPDAGESWADRFDLAGNPDPERAWPLQRVSYSEDGEALTLELAFTFADAMALEPAYFRHLLVVPPVAWDDNQQPLAEYLEQFDPEAPERRVPFLWVVDADGMLQRAIVTRELALASRDRLRGWRVLQELAGYQNVFAERAAADAREQALAEAGEQTAELEQAHADELERVRSEAARESMERLAALLISPDGIPVLGAPAARAAPPPPPAEAAEAVAAEPAAVEEVEEEEAVSFDEPYIDTPLCTSCNECTNLNAQLFHYNAEKQAYIADPAAGSFAELVKAAELCPAHCIHPGKPRDGDSTATPELIERAAKFN
jgi:ferredoxin